MIVSSRSGSHPVLFVDCSSTCSIASHYSCNTLKIVIMAKSLVLLALALTWTVAYGQHHQQNQPPPPATNATHRSRHNLSGGGHATEGTFTRMEHAGEEILHKVADKSHIPFWGVLLILLCIVLVILVAFYFCLAKYWRKFTESDKGARFKGLDLKSVNLIGQLGKEKVQPESEGLTSNMEENEEEQKEEEKKEAEKLGRLQFKLDYDFNSNNVCILITFL